MEKLIEFLKSLFTKSAASFNKDKAEILTAFTETKEKLEKLAASVDATALKHDVTIALANAKIEAANLEKEALAEAKAQAAAVAKKIEALLS
jgi:hypothetical protein